MDDGAQVELLGGEAWEAVGQVEAHLVAEDADGAGAGAVLALGAVVEHILQKVKILSHILRDNNDGEGEILCGAEKKMGGRLIC